MPVADDSFVCLCRRSTVQSPTARPFVRLRAMAVRASALRAAGCDPLALCGANAWAAFETAFDAGTAPVREVVPDRTEDFAPGCGDLAGITSSFTGREHREFRMALSLDASVGLARAAMRWLPITEQARCSFAIGVRKGSELPIEPTLVVWDEPRAQTRDGAASREVDAGGADRGEDVLARLASCEDVSVLWRGRLWNGAQDVLILSEEAQTWEASRRGCWRFRSLLSHGRYARRLRLAKRRLLLEMRRACVDAPTQRMVAEWLATR